MILFGGFIANASSTPAWLGWIQWISPIRYGNECLAHTQFDDADNVYAAKYLVEEGFTIGYWNCLLACFALAIIWRILAVIMLNIQISKFQ